MNIRDIRFAVRQKLEPYESFDRDAPSINDSCTDPFKKLYDEIDLGNNPDPGAQSVSKAMVPVLSWAQNNPRKELQAYTVGLRLAALAVGGPASAILDLGSKIPGSVRTEVQAAQNGLLELSSQAGANALPLMEVAVPATWSSPNGDGVQKRLSASLEILRAGREDLLPYLHLAPQEENFDVARLDSIVKTRQQTQASFENDFGHWPKVELFGFPGNSQGQEVSFLQDRDGKLESFTGVVEPPKDQWSAAFRLVGLDRDFNSNYLSDLRARPQEQKT